MDDLYLFLQLLWDGVAVGAVYALMAFGFALIYFTTRVLHFAHGAIAILLAYVIFVLADSGGLHWAVAAAVAVPIGFLLGAATEVLLYQTVRRRSGADALPGGSLFIASLGLALVIINLLPLEFGSAPRFLGDGPTAGALLVFDDRIALSHIHLVSVPAALVALGLAILWLRVSGVGRKIRAVVDDVDTAVLVGIRVDRINVLVLGLGSAFAVGVATVQLLAGGANSQTGHTLMIATVAAAIIGGIGSISGAIAGGFLIGIAANVALIRLPTAWGEGVIYTMLLLFIAFRPQGLFGHRSVRRI